jgi:hypothetical protein
MSIASGLTHQWGRGPICPPLPKNIVPQTQAVSVDMDGRILPRILCSLMPIVLWKGCFVYFMRRFSVHLGSDRTSWNNVDNIDCPTLWISSITIEPWPNSNREMYTTENRSETNFCNFGVLSKKWSKTDQKSFNPTVSSPAHKQLRNSIFMFYGNVVVASYL